MTLCRSITVIESTFCDDTNLSASNVTLVVCLDTLAATAGSLSIDFSAVHIEITVAADSCRRLGVTTIGECLVNLPGTISCGNDSRTSTINRDVSVTVDSLAAICGNLYVDDTAIDEHVVTSLDAIVLRGVYIEVDTFLYDDITLAMDTILVITIDLQGTIAIDKQFAFAEDSTFVVFCRTVRKFVGACQYHVGTALSLHVNSRCCRTGDVGIVEVQLEIGTAINDQ